VNDLQTIQLNSIEELRSNAAAWDDLWWRSDAKLPTSRAELLAQWVEQFAPRETFKALVVADGQRWVAALPLVSRRLAKLLPIGTMPCNPWSSGGELLLDSSTDAEPACEMLLSSAANLPWPMIWLDEVTPESSGWQSFIRATEQTSADACYHERYRVGRVEIRGNWTEYQKRLAKNHRQALNRSLRRLRYEGEVTFEMQSNIAGPQIADWLNAALEIENRSWKGDSGTSILSTPGMAEFFTRQAEQISQWGQLETAALKLDNRMLAFVYGFRVRGVYFAYKIGYDPRFSAFSPGRLLFMHILEHLHADRETTALDFMGPMADWHLRWRPTTYGVGRTVIAKPDRVGRSSMYVYRNLWRPLRDLNSNLAKLRRHKNGIATTAEEPTAAEHVERHGPANRRTVS
jgi:CelD/BcsL family acetyltransferase involved in cellulose biosynthesis